MDATDEHDFAIFDLRWVTEVHVYSILQPPCDSGVICPAIMIQPRLALDRSVLFVCRIKHGYGAHKIFFCPLCHCCYIPRAWIRIRVYVWRWVSACKYIYTYMYVLVLTYISVHMGIVIFLLHIMYYLWMTYKCLMQLLFNFGNKLIFIVIVIVWVVRHLNAVLPFHTIIYENRNIFLWVLMDCISGPCDNNSFVPPLKLGLDEQSYLR